MESLTPRIKDYTPGHSHAKTWRAEVKHPRAYCPHPASDTAVGLPRATLGDLLNALIGSDFLFRIDSVREGRKLEKLKSDPVVAAVAAAVKRTTHSRSAIEAWLDRILAGVIVGKVFEHNESVMGLLVALSEAADPLFLEVAEVFAGSPAAELAPLSRLAKQMLKRV